MNKSVNELLEMAKKVKEQSEPTTVVDHQIVKIKKAIDELYECLDLLFTARQEILDFRERASASNPTKK